MSKKKEAIQDQAVAALGGLVGSGLGALAGPEGMAAGGAAGSVGALLVSKYAPEYFDNSVLRRYLSNRKVAGILKAKIEADLKNSFLGSQSDFDLAMKSMRSLLQAASSQDRSIGSLDSRLPRNFRWSLVNMDCDEEAFQQHLSHMGTYCQQNGPVRIGC